MEQEIKNLQETIKNLQRGIPVYYPPVQNWLKQSISLGKGGM